jgi:hypothetical protein
LTIIGEEFPRGPVSLDQIADILEGAIIKRRAGGREHGVALLAEGLIERLDPATLSQVERDPYGNVRLAELELSRLLKERVASSLKTAGSASASSRRTSATSFGARRPAGSTSTTVGASATGRPAFCSRAAPTRW